MDAALARAAAHGADLHHLAAMLTSSTEAATALVARTLLAAGEGGDADQLETGLVRAYLRTAPRRTERAGPRRPHDAGDLLRTLRPRARAASALRLVRSWEPPAVAAAVGVRPHRVDALVPATPDLALALTAAADQRALTGPELDRELTDEIRAAAPRAAPGTGRRRWARLATAAVPLAVVAGWAVAPDGPDDDPAVTAGPHAGPAVDLGAAGWALDEEGEAPLRPLGHGLAAAVSVDAGDPPTEVVWAARADTFSATFAVLWCDMPPTEDANIIVPSGTLTVGTTVVALPCVGRDGSPLVTQLVPVPPGGTGQLEVAGDLPPGGGATLGVYTEDDSVRVSPPGGATSALAQAPPAPPGSVVLDPTDTVPGPTFGTDRRVWRTAAVEIGHDSQVRVWAGGAGSVSVLVDGAPATDDGDMASISAWLRAGGPAKDSGGPESDWAAQQPGLRWGQWFAYVPDEVRTFPVPESVRPGRGERRTVSVEVATEGMGEEAQVAVLDATAAEVDTLPLAALEHPDAPEQVLGRRLVGAWSVPQDGHRRQLLGVDGTLGALVPLGTWAEEPVQPAFWGLGYLQHDDQVAQVTYDLTLEEALVVMTMGWTETVLPGDGPLYASAAAAPGHPDSTLYVYTPVTYEDFDFAAAPVPPGSWPQEDYPAPDSQLTRGEPVAEVRPDDLEDGRATVDLGRDRLRGLRITTEGRGRMLLLQDGRPLDLLRATDGWWSSWTDDPVVSELDLAAYGGPGADAADLTVVVEDYDDFTVEVLGE